MLQAFDLLQAGKCLTVCHRVLQVCSGCHANLAHLRGTSMFCQHKQAAALTAVAASQHFAGWDDQ